MARQPIDDKTRTLRERGCLNAHPEHVRDELFLSNAFFDPRDLLQVKYEMLRRVREEGEPVSAAATRFGLSRPTFYTAQCAYETGGLPALAPARPGPRRAHKLGAEVVEALRAAREQRPPPSSRELVGTGARAVRALGAPAQHRPRSGAAKKNARERRAPPQRAGDAGPLRDQL